MRGRFSYTVVQRHETKQEWNLRIKGKKNLLCTLVYILGNGDQRKCITMYYTK